MGFRVWVRVRCDAGARQESAAVEPDEVRGLGHLVQFSHSISGRMVSSRLVGWSAVVLLIKSYSPSNRRSKRPY